MSQENRYIARFKTPDFLQRNEDQTIECPVYFDGNLVAPSVGIVSVFDESKNAIVDEQAITVSSSISTYTIGAAILPTTLALSELWTIKWVLTYGSIDYTFVRSAALVRTKLYPVVSDEDLKDIHIELDQFVEDSKTSYQSYIEAAFIDVELRLLENGKRPYLVINPSSLYGLQKARALMYAFRDFWSSAGTASGKYKELSEVYAKEYELAWDRLGLTYDYDQNGFPDSGETGQAGSPVIMTSLGGAW